VKKHTTTTGPVIGLKGTHLIKLHKRRSMLHLQVNLFSDLYKFFLLIVCMTERDLFFPHEFLLVRGFIDMLGGAFTALIACCCRLGRLLCLKIHTHSLEQIFEMFCVLCFLLMKKRLIIWMYSPIFFGISAKILYKWHCLPFFYQFRSM